MKETLFLVFFFFFLLVTISRQQTPAADAPKGKMFYPTMISVAKLTIAREVLDAKSARICTMIASVRPWCTLMCYQENQCSLYDLLFAANHRDNTSDIVNYCRTTINGCVNNGKILEQGVNATVNCKLLTCHNNVMKPYSEVSNQNFTADFTYVDQVGYVKVFEVPMQFCEARTFCSTMGGDLVVAHNYTALTNHLGQLPLADTQYWFGVQYGIWLDGSDVPIELWLVPAGPLYCARALTNVGFKLAENSCTKPYHVVCQL